MAGNLAVKARIILAGGAFDPSTLRIVWDAFDIAWGQIAPGISTNPQAIQAARTKLATVMLEVATGLEEFDAAGLAQLTLERMYATHAELDGSVLLLARGQPCKHNLPME